MKILFARHSTMVVDINGKKILIDPALDPKGTVTTETGPNPKIAVETSIEDLTNVDGILVTHLHGDHFDDEAKKLLPKDLPMLCQSEDENDMKECGFNNVIPIEKEVNWKNLKITRVNAQHGSGAILKSMGIVSGFVIEDNDYCVYVVGDSIWYEEVEKTIEKFNPNVIIINAGAANLGTGPITMNESDIYNVINKAPKAKIVAVHMDAWGHCELTKAKLKNFLREKHIEEKVIIPLENTEFSI